MPEPRLLFDQQLSPCLVSRLSDLYPAASHVSLVGLDRASDEAVWAFAQANEFIIVTKDADFGDLGVLRGFPPQVIWLRLGNCTTAHVESTLRFHHPTIRAFSTERSAGVLMLFGTAGADDTTAGAAPA
jgi:predicted nuclease of predicted toxin-antitoxin system